MRATWNATRPRYLAGSASEAVRGVFPPCSVLAGGAEQPGPQKSLWEDVLRGWAGGKNVRRLFKNPNETPPETPRNRDWSFLLVQMVAVISYVLIWAHCIHRLGNPGETGVTQGHVTRAAAHVTSIAKYNTEREGLCDDSHCHQYFLLIFFDTDNSILQFLLGEKN